MTGLTPAHHDWIKDLSNVDPRVFEAPDPDVEAPLDKLGQPNINNFVSMDIDDLAADFSNSVFAAVKRAKAAMSDLGVAQKSGWNIFDAKGAAAILAKSAPPISDTQRAILDEDVAQIKQSVLILKDMTNELDEKARTFKAASDELAAMPRTVDDPPPLKSNFFDDNGDILEHVWDAINQVTQMTLKLGDLHLLAGMDLIKDAIKNDQTQKQLDAINTQLDQQRAALNAVIGAVAGRAAADRDNAALAYGKKIDALKEQLPLCQDAIARYSRDFDAFESKKNAAGGKKPPDKNTQAVLTTYKAVLEAGIASRFARDLLNTKTLGPEAHKRFAAQMIPLGKPVTDDARTGGACLFLKNGTPVRYSQTVATTEALASGLELVVSVYNDAAMLDPWFKDWSAAMKARP